MRAFTEEVDVLVTENGTKGIRVTRTRGLSLKGGQFKLVIDARSLRWQVGGIEAMMMHALHRPGA